MKRDAKVDRATDSGQDGDRATVGARTRVAARYGTALAKALPDTGDQGPTIHDAATAAVEHKGGGSAVDAGVATRVGAHLGADLGGVRVHQDPLAQEASAAMGARAFAHGSDVFLGAGESGTDLGLMAHELTHVVQQGAAGQRAPQRKVEVGDANSPAEAQADAVASAVTGGAAPASLIVDDGPVSAGQMLKSTFIEQLRGEVMAAARDELGPLESLIGCPYIEQYFARYAPRPAAESEAILKKFAPGARAARSAAELIPAVVARVREGVHTWRETGQAPPDLAAADPAAAAVATRATPAVDDAEVAGSQMSAEDPGTADLGGADAGGGVQLARLDASPSSGDELVSQVGAGAAPTGRVAEIAGMLGVDAGAMRIHDGPRAAQLAQREDAAAMALGSHVVFGAGELQPGSIAGDALIAHEVAHVAQQTGGAMPATVARALAARAGDDHEGLASSAEEPGPALGPDPVTSVEGDADRAAGGVLAQLYGGARSALSTARAAVTAPVGLARCTNTEKKAKASATPDIALTKEATGKHIVDGMGKLNTGGGLDTGLHYSHNYERMAKAQDPSKWKDDYRKGYANPAYWTRTGFMQWQLNGGVRASEAIKDWLKGLTIAECLSTVRVLQMDAIRASLGDARFDEQFGPESGTAGVEQLTIGVGATTVTNYRKNVAPPGDAGTHGNRPAEVGGQYYFTNHPQYLLKHPGGAWQGENALYMGRVNGIQMWSGFGADSVSEDAMLDEMVRAYNHARDANDTRVLGDITTRNGGTLPAQYDPASFPDQIDKAAILSAPASTIDGKVRKGGFNAGNGLALDIDKVKALQK